jgi:hypothetical protein
MTTHPSNLSSLINPRIAQEKKDENPSFKSFISHKPYNCINVEAIENT